MSDKLWKQTERRIAKYFGGVRNPIATGLCDVSTPTLSIQVKEKEILPKWMAEAMAEARRECEPGKLAIVVWHEKGAAYDDNIVQILAKDFRDWYV